MVEIKMVSIATHWAYLVIPNHDKSLMINWSIETIPTEVLHNFHQGQKTFWGDVEVKDDVIKITNWTCENIHKQNEKLQTFLDFFNINAEITDGQLCIRLDENHEYEVSVI